MWGRRCRTFGSLFSQVKHGGGVDSVDSSSPRFCGFLTFKISKTTLKIKLTGITVPMLPTKKLRSRKKKSRTDLKNFLAFEPEPEVSSPEF